MREEIKNALKAFVTGFVTISGIMILLQIFAPFVGVDVGISTGFALGVLEAKKALTISIFAPFLVGVLFAIIELVEDFESELAEYYHDIMKTDESKEAASIVVHGVYGAVLGFIVVSLLMMMLIGLEGSYSIPFIFHAEAEGASVEGNTVLVSITTVMGMIYGYWKARK